MKRKIIKQGHQTLTMTLPMKWAQKHHIKAGDEIDLLEQGRDLKICPQASDLDDRAVIDISGLMIPLVWRFISSAYRAGYNEIKIIFENRGFRHLYTAFTYNTLYPLKDGKEQELSPLEAIQALVNRFVGFEIIEQKPNYCVIKDLGETSAKEFDNTLRRIFLLLQTMSDAVLLAVDKNDEEGLRGMHIIDSNVDRFEDYCLRILNKQGYGTYKQTTSMYSLILVLELVGDDYKKLGLHVLSMKKVSEEVKTYFRHIDTMIRAYYEFYYRFSKEGAEKIFRMDEEAYRLFDQISPPARNEEKELMHHLKKISRYIITLTELRIDMEYQGSEKKWGEE
ncbi:MAG: AbrB/MazE/SpoVT family DNA-binding domain-containing protein [Nanoarchaeota archaeon]